MRPNYFLISSAALAGLGLICANEALADYATGFESPAYISGQTLNGQDGWITTQQANIFGTGDVYTTADNIVVSNTNPSTGSQAITTSLVTYDNQGGGYQIAGFLASHSVPTTTTPTLVTFDLRVNNDVNTNPDIVDKAFFLTNASGYAIAGIDFQRSGNNSDNSVGFYTFYDNGGAAYPTNPRPQPHQFAAGVNANVVLTPNAYQTWGIEEVPSTSMIHYFLNGADVYDTPCFQGSSISGITFMMQNQESLSYNQTQTGETVNLDNISVAPPPSVWVLPGSGDWNVSSSWALVIPNSVGATASFLGAITANATVNVTTPETVGAMVFDNLHSYTIAGSGAVTLTSDNGPATIHVNSGSQVIQTTLNYASGLNVTTAADPGGLIPSLTLPLNIYASGAMTKSGPGTLAFAASLGGIKVLNLPSISIASGTVILNSASTPGTRTLLSTSSLSISGKLDLGRNDLELQSGNTAGLSDVMTYLAQGYNSIGGGNWSGISGIISSAARSDISHLTVLGVILNSSNQTSTGTAIYSNAPGSLGLFDGTNPSNTDVLVKFTYYGDTNLDGKVDGSDYTHIDFGYLTHATGWYNGDFNYDGVINGSDYTLIDNAFNTQRASLATSIAAAPAASTSQIAGSSSVPEPATLELVSLTLLGILTCRRSKVHMS